MGSSISPCSCSSACACSKCAEHQDAPDRLTIRKLGRNTRLTAEGERGEGLSDRSLSQLAAYVTLLEDSEKAAIWRAIRPSVLSKEKWNLEIVKNVANTQSEMKDLIIECARRVSTDRPISEREERMFALTAQYLFFRLGSIDLWEVEEEEKFCQLLRDCDEVKWDMNDLVHTSDEHIVCERTMCVVNRWIKVYQVSAPEQAAHSTVVRLITDYFFDQGKDEIRDLVALLLTFQERTGVKARRCIWSHAVSRSIETTSLEAHFVRLVSDFINVYAGCMKENLYMVHSKKGLSLIKLAPIAYPIGQYLHTTFRAMNRRDFIHNKWYFARMLHAFYVSRV